MPVFDQSVARYVRFILSKILTISSMIVSFGFSNTACSCGFQWNLLCAFRSSRKGNIVLAILSAYDTWLTRPNQDLMSLKLCGVGKSYMALRYFLYGLTESFVISKPANSTSSSTKRKFSGLRVIPCLPQLSSQFAAWKKLSLIVSDHRRVLSIHLVLFGMEEPISSQRLV